MSSLNLESGLSFKISKVSRSFQIYGVSRTLVKLVGRFRSNFFRLISHVLFFHLGAKKKKRVVSFVGCGQASFTCLAFFLRKFTRSKFSSCMDLSEKNAKSFSDFYRIKKCTTEAPDFFSDLKSDLVYVATNHASHADYAISAMRAGADVYVEKPLVVSREQLVKVGKCVEETGRKIFVGYNRPFSKAISKIKQLSDHKDQPLSLSFFIIGHFIPKDHWYRNPDEGTRVCGNLGHWLDLPIHMLSWRERKAQDLQIDITYSAEKYIDENLTVSLTTDHGDLITIVFTARSEPFEGVYEFVNLQWGDLIAHIEDFRTMKVWKNSSKSKFRYWPKDVGHKAAVLQPFEEISRDWTELETSTLLMLAIKEMVLKREIKKTFNIQNELNSYKQDVAK